MRNRFSTDLKEAISLSAEEAVRMGSHAIGAAHLLLGLVRQGHNRAVTLLSDELHVPLPVLVAAIEETLPQGVGKREMDGSWHLPLDRGAERSIRGSMAEAKREGSRTIDSGHLLYSLFEDRKNNLYLLFKRWGIERMPVRPNGQ